MEFSLIYTLPLWSIALFLFVIMLVALEIGLQLGFRQQIALKDANAGGGEIVLTSMFALLGLILAFTYGASVERFDARKKVVIEEANTLGTAFLVARLVAEPERTEMREALLDYARTRRTKPGEYISNQDRKKLLKFSLEKQAVLWPTTERIVLKPQPDFIKKSLIKVVTDVLDTHTKRIAAITDKLPNMVFWMLILLSVSTLLVAGFHAGVSGRVSRWRMYLFALVLTGVIELIVDFDRPSEGLVRVAHNSISMVIIDMEADLKQ